MAPFILTIQTLYVGNNAVLKPPTVAYLPLHPVISRCAMSRRTTAVDHIL